MKTIRYKIIKYLIPFIGIPNFSYCAFSIYFMVNDKEKYTTINTPSGVNKYEYIKKYETANNCIENNTIPDADTLDIKTLFTTGFVSYNGSHNRNHPEFSYIKYDNIDDLIFLYFKFQPSSYPIKITDTLQITNFKKTIGSHAGIIIYAITKNTLNHLKKLQITHIRINGGKYTLDKPIKIFSNEQDVIETLKEGIPTGEIINDRYKTTAIKDFVLKQDPDLWIDERTKYNISLNSKDTETIGEDNLYETEDTDLCFNIFPNYGVELEYEYKLPPNTSLRKISEYGTDGEDGFGDHNCYLPQKTHIEFKTKTHQITNEELLKPIDEHDENKNKKKYKMIIDKPFDFPKFKKYKVTVTLPETSELLRSVFIYIDIPGKNYPEKTKYHANDDLCKLNDRYIIHCDCDFDTDVILNKLTEKIKTKINDAGLQTKITDEMINNTIIKEMKDKVEKSRYDIRRTNVCFGKDEFEKYIDTFKPLLLENKPEEFQSQPKINNTNNNNQTTTIYNKNKTKKFGNKKSKCCCNKCC